MGKIIVIGGGPAGIMAALTAADYGAAVELWERNNVLGRKLSITGKGRCNITNNTGIDELIANLNKAGSFLYSAFSKFDAQDTISFFEQRCNLPLKTERGRRVFPSSDKAADVVTALAGQLKQAGVHVLYEKRAKRIGIADGQLKGVYDYNGTFHDATAVIVATCGMSYPRTGSDGDGLQLAKKVGHSIVDVRPALVPLETYESWPKELSGLSLKNVEVKVLGASGDRVLEKAFGEMLFTHFGVSGPIILTLSRNICNKENRGNGIKLSIDLKPALSAEQMHDRVHRNMTKFSRKHYGNSLSELLPASLIPVFIHLSGIAADKPVNQLTRAEFATIAELLKDLPLTVKTPRPLAEAIVTAGGISTKEVNPKTMESKLIKGLYFAGEVLDIDGYTGGYNLQVAWSSGFCAGQAAAWSLNM